MSGYSKYVTKAWPLLLGLILFAGCAGKPKTVGLEGPPRPEIGSDADPSQQVENLDLETLLSRGRDYLAKGNLELAAIHYDQALQRDPKSVEVFTGLGELMWLRGKPEAAKQAYNKALAEDENYLPALIGAGRVLRQLGDTANSEQLLARARELAPDNPEALTELAVVYDHRGFFQQAEPLYRKVTESAPGKSGPLNNLGFNLLLQERYVEATTTLKNALAMNPQDKHIKNNLAAAYLLAGEETRGMELFSDSVGQAGAWNNVGYIHMTRGEWDAAERSFNRALDINPVFYSRAKQNLQRVKELRNSKE